MLKLRKIFMDLWSNKSRTSLLILSIFLGTFLVGLIFRSWLIVSREMAASFEAINPHQIMLTTARPFDHTLVSSVADMAEVATAEGRHTEYMRVQVGADTWQSLELVSVQDFDNVRINQLAYEEGAWPPPIDTAVLDESSLEQIEAIFEDDFDEYGQKASLLVEQRSGKQFQLPISGAAYDLSQMPTHFSQILYAYVTPQTMRRLTGTEGYSQLYVTADLTEQEDEEIAELAVRLERKLADSGYPVISTASTAEPAHPLYSISQTVLALLLALSVISLILGAFQILNSVSALLAQQVPQIGILKSLGATRFDIYLIYFGIISLFSLLTLALSLPLVALFSRELAYFLSELLHFTVSSYDIPWWGYLPELFAAWAVPLLVSWSSIRRLGDLSINEILRAKDGRKQQFGVSRFDQALNLLQGLPATGLYTLRNIFRNKKRLALTLVVLMISGATFIMVSGTRKALLSTLEQIAAYRLQDFEIRFVYPERIEKVEQIALSHPEVTAVESRFELRAVPIKRVGVGAEGQTQNDDTAMGDVVISGLVAETEFLIPTMLEGRWLEPADENKMVVNAEFRAELDEMQIGDWVEMEINGRESTWQIVGVAMGQIVAGGEILSPMAYVPHQRLASLAGVFGNTDHILVKVAPGVDAAEFSTELNQAFASQGVEIRAVTLKSTVQTVVELPFQIVLSVVFVMILLFALAGGLGLMGLMSLNVLERTHELGVLRATGASPAEILTTILLEGMVVGGLSWIGASLLALPMGRLLNNIVGQLLLKVPLSASFSWDGVLYWLLIVIPLSALASFIPAWRASQVTVSDALNYE